ncbi:receptor-type tyrosine-protein phosphatase H-like isoform X3 [Toxotes jaculatrix]|uniref:receptor-type tyrosine-protein phosphatase H-like isoform X3 n=1 Tax=Toxotes jaculatrix TaxID=941984 RepID=UPI001B3B1051|nr:receptor-type tyrosine-protein phosphatase H-like isoform X3 [Toxotes jaculatrix]
MMKLLSFKITSDHLLLCVFLNLLWGVAESNISSTATVTDSKATTTPSLTATSPLTTSTTTTLPTTKPPPDNVKNVTVLRQNVSSITLKWDKVNNISTYILQYNDSGSTKNENISATPQETSVEYVVSALTAGTKYVFTLITVFEGVNSTGHTFTAVTAPRDTEVFKSVGQSETSITLQWKKVDNILKYALKFNGVTREINVTATTGDNLMNHTISNLTSATEYNFTLFAEFENVRSSGVYHIAATAPRNAEVFKSVGQNETSITLQWKKVDNILQYTLKWSEGVTREINVTATTGDNLMNHTISNLTSATKYNFTLFAVFENVRSSGINLVALTDPENVKNVTVLRQTVSSITLKWDKVNNSSTYILQYNDSGSTKNESINATLQETSVEYVVSALTAGTKYVFTLITVFEGLNSTGHTFTAVTVPKNADDFKVEGQNETSITLQWKNVGNVDYILVLGPEERNISSSTGDQVNHTISNLTSATKYNFTLLSVFENVRSSGVYLVAFTAPENVKNVIVLRQTVSSITLKWDKVNNSSTYILQYNDSGSTKNESINATLQETSVEYVVSSLTAGIKYVFTLITVFERVSSSGHTFTAVTAPRDTEEFKSVGQSETSITLQWKKVDNILKYALEFDRVTREINVTATTGDNLMNHTISTLTSATKYNFTLFAEFENVRSSGVNHIAATAPRNAEDFKSVGQSETSITLLWKNVDNILQYTLKWSEGVTREINVTATTGHNLMNHTISNLTSATKYNFTLLSVFENVRSSGVNHIAATVPENVKLVTVTQTVNSITLTWDKVKEISTYILRYGDSDLPVKGNSSKSHQNESVTYVVAPLTAGKKYNFTLITVFEGLNSTGHQFTAVTVPPMVSSVNVTERSVTSLTLKWENLEKNWNYLLQINDSYVTVTPDVPPNVVSHPVTHLKPGTEYPFRVITMFSGLNSTAYEDFTVTAIDCASVSWRVTNSTIQGTVEGIFSNATASNRQTHVSTGGNNVLFTGLYPGATYEVLLAYERNSKRFEQCRQNLTIFPPSLRAHCEYSEAGYSIMIAWNKPEGVWTEVEVNVTGQTHFANEGEQYIKISGFQPAKTYEVSVDSLSGTVRSYEPFVFLCSTDPRGVIAGAVVAVVLFVVLVCVAVFILFKRPGLMRKKPFIGASKLSDKNDKTISVAKFPDHFSQLSADDNRGFSQEYENLVPVGTEQTRKTAILPENKARNRFNNVLPYDWCRVRLTTSNSNVTSDYINASYMPGYNSNREYIATQGPLPSTVGDFWRMIWEQKAKRIVMVTNCVEGGRTKCEQYWPADNKPCLYGEVLVTTRSEQKELSWTLREFRVKHTNYSEERTVKHFHFTAWPDHGVPQGTKVLIQFRGLVRWHIEREGTGAPTVVHCSAGVGRTGTIIALDVLLQQLDKKRAVGINSFVHKMRLYRPYMVQTESQYIFLHHCIMDSLQPDENIYENADMIYVNATALRELR